MVWRINDVPGEALETIICGRDGDGGFTIESSFIVSSLWCKWWGLQLILADFLILLFSLFDFVLLARWFYCWKCICLPGFDVMPVNSNFMFLESFACSWEIQCIGLCHNKSTLFFLIFIVPLFPNLSIPLLMLHGTQLIFFFEGQLLKKIEESCHCFSKKLVSY